jgi:tetratricopeptide (TPR) repeat protein
VQLGRIYMQVGELDKALEYGKRAVALEPNGADTNAIYGHMLEAAGRPDEALTYVNKALRLAPTPSAWIPWLQGNCLRQLGHYDDAITAYQRAIVLAPSFSWPRVFIVDAYMAAGQEEEAKARAREVLQIEPSLSVEEFFKVYVWYRDPSFLKGYAANLRKAGLK